MNRLMRLREAGVSIWLGTFSRELLQTGEFARAGDHAMDGAVVDQPDVAAGDLDAGRLGGRARLPARDAVLARGGVAGR